MTDNPGSVVEVEFAVQSPAYPFCRGSEEIGCTFDLAQMVPRPGPNYAEFFHIQGTDPGTILDLVEESETVEATLLDEYDHGGLFEFLVSGRCPAHRIAELGALPQTVRASDGRGRIVADIPPRRDPQPIIESFLAETDGTDFVMKQEKPAVSPLASMPDFRRLVRDGLTDRQFEVIRTAYAAGYYEWPREATGEEIAAELGISSATFSEHVHAAERNLLTALFDRQ
ncbi:MAG: putative DNA binding protein [Natronomonas sp.]|jgi:predicted DNA binding protein